MDTHRPSSIRVSTDSGIKSTNAMSSPEFIREQSDLISSALISSGFAVDPLFTITYRDASIKGHAMPSPVLGEPSAHQREINRCKPGIGPQTMNRFNGLFNHMHVLAGEPMSFWCVARIHSPYFNRETVYIPIKVCFVHESQVLVLLAEMPYDIIDTIDTIS